MRPDSFLILGDVSYYPKKQKLLDKKGAELKLRPQSLAVLHLLAAKSNEVVSKDEIFQTVWPDVVVSDDSLVQCVGDIRRAVGDDKYTILQTVPRRGYKLIATVGSQAGTAASRRPYFLLPFILGGVLISILLGLSAFVILPSTGDVSGDVSDVSVSSSSPSISVLPFKNLTDYRRWGRLAEGLSAEIANELARNHWLFITAPASTGQDPEGQFVLDGSIQAEHENLRISARLTDVPTGKIVWAERWQRPAQDIFIIQDEILQKVEAAVSGAWSGVVAKEGLSKARNLPTVSLDAYELFLLGTEYKHKFTAEDDEIAASYLKKAVEIDPGYSKAWTTLAVLRANQSVSVGDKKRRSELAEERQYAALKAYEADPADPDVLLQLSWLKGKQGDFGAAADAVRQAVSLASDNPDILAHAAWLAAFRNPALSQKGLVWGEKAISLIPAHPPWYLAGTGIAAFHAGEWQRSLDYLNNAPEIADVLIHRTAAAALLGNKEEATRAVVRFKEIVPADFTVYEYAELNALHKDTRAQLIKGAEIAGLPIGGKQ